jgi:hypothetical protein
MRNPDRCEIRTRFLCRPMAFCSTCWSCPTAPASRTKSRRTAEESRTTLAYVSQLIWKIPEHVVPIGIFHYLKNKIKIINGIAPPVLDNIIQKRDNLDITLDTQIFNKYHKSAPQVMYLSLLPYIVTYIIWQRNLVLLLHMSLSWFEKFQSTWYLLGYFTI